MQKKVKQESIMWTKPEGYYSKFKYVEVARYLEIEGQKMVARYMQDKDKKIPLLVPWDEVPTYARKNNNTGIYTSIFRYSNDRFSDRATRLGSLYFDIDSDEATTALNDARAIAKYLTRFVPVDSIRLYFTGKKGFHIECEAVVLGISPSADLPGIFRFIASDIATTLSISSIDSAVYDARRMWRLPNSIHQATGLYKIPITLGELETLSYVEISKLAESPRKLTIPSQEFNIKTNEWYRDLTYKYEQTKLQQDVTAQSIIERFNQHGSVTLTEYEKEFDPIKLFEGCPAIMELWNKAETKHDLEHEERLFLCSILSYTDEAIGYLHSILSNCHDYSFEKSQSHIDDWVRRRAMGIGGRPYTCERARSAGIECAGCENLEPKIKYERIGDKLYPTNETSPPSPIRLAYSKKED